MIRFFACMSLCILGLVAKTSAQEFNCKVTVNTPKLQVADPKIFKSFETAVRELMNNRDWTNRDFEPEERIDLDLLITIDEEISQTQFKAQLILQASRPVYGSDYNSVLIKHVDKDFVFNYGEFEVLDFAENTYTSNLTSMLAYYAYIVLGLDADSFEELGGDEYFNKAQEILNTVPQGERGVFTGWDPGTSTRNRHWLIENLLNVRMRPFREAAYLYHLKGLDQLTDEENRTDGLKSMLQGLNNIQAANQQYPGSMIVQVYVNSKYQEIIDAFRVADMNTRRQVHSIMLKLDATRASEYANLLKPLR